MTKNLFFDPLVSGHTIYVLTKMLSLQVSGARIKISDRGDFMSGTSDRYESLPHVIITE